jgi:hypothetical protein
MRARVNIVTGFVAAVALLFPIAIAHADQNCVATNIVAGCSSGGGASTSGNNTWTGTNSFIDANFSLLDDGDNTKVAKFQLSGITTGTTRTYTFPNASVTLPGIDFNSTWTASQTITADTVGWSFGAIAGNASDSVRFSTAQTPDSGVFTTGTTSNAWHIYETADSGFDFTNGPCASSACTDPTLIIHSHNQSTTEYLSVSHNGTNAILSTGAGAIVMAPIVGGGNRYYFSNTDLRAGNAQTVGFSSAADPATAGNDTFLTRESAAVMQFGADVNGTGVAYTLKSPDGITGSNVKGGDVTIASGRGTGNAAAASVHIQVPNMLGTGTTAQVLADRIVACESKTLSNTSATATALANITLASNSAGAAFVTFSVQCNDGTNFDSDIVTSYVAYVNKAAAVTVGTPVTTGTAAANNSGSCTVAPTFVANGNSIDVKVTPVITTIAPTTTTGFVTVQSFGSGTVACQ